LSVADKLAYLNNTKTLIRAVIIGKGGMVPENCTFRELVFRIADLPGGGVITYYPTGGAYTDPMLDGMYPV
jgi:hypothetical protein